MTGDAWRERGFWRAEALFVTLDHALTVTGAASRIIDSAQDMPLSALKALALRIGGGLATAGISRGDGVIIQSRNSIDAFATLIACLARGHVAIPLPPMFSAAQVAAVVANSGASALIMLDEKAGERAPEVVRSCPGLDAVYVPDPMAGGALKPWSTCRDAAPARPVPLDADADQLVLYSSGSTGNPKGVVHSANTLRFAAGAVGRFHDVTAVDTVLVALEFGFVGGTILGALTALLAGANLVLMRQWDPEQALFLIEQRRVSYSLLMPTHVYDVMNCPALDRTECRSFRRGILAGVPRHVREDAMRRFCARPLPMFGMSESIGHVTFAPDDPLDALLNLDGRALPATEIAVRDADGQAARPGETGDLFLRGPNRLLRYLGDEALTAASILPGGWFRTGDRAMLDERGYMLFVGRAKEIIRRGGVTILPADIEAALLKHPLIAEAAVVPTPDARLGEKACACLVPRPGASLDLAEITRHLAAENLARYQWPEHMLIFDALPRTPSLKVRRAELEAEARRRLEQQRSDAGQSS